MVAIIVRKVKQTFKCSRCGGNCLQEADLTLRCILCGKEA